MAAQITDQQAQQVSSRSWTTRRDEKQRRRRLVSSWMKGPLLPRDKLVESLQLLIAPGDRIVLEGDNQKQADFLSRSLVRADPKTLHDLHLINSSISRPEHLNVAARALRNKETIAQDLVSNIAHGVRWHDAMTVLKELGCNAFSRCLRDIS